MTKAITNAEELLAAKREANQVAAYLADIDRTPVETTLQGYDWLVTIIRQNHKRMVAEIQQYEIDSALVAHKEEQE